MFLDYPECSQVPSLVVTKCQCQICKSSKTETENFRLWVKTKPVYITKLLQNATPKHCNNHTQKAPQTASHSISHFVGRSVGPSVGWSVRRKPIARSTRLMAIGLVLLISYGRKNHFKLPAFCKKKKKRRKERTK